MWLLHHIGFSVRASCGGLSEQVTQGFWLRCPAVRPVTMAGRVSPAGAIEGESSKSQDVSAWAVLSVFLLEAERGRWRCGLSGVFALLSALLGCSSGPGRQAWKRREDSAVCGVMLAQHFPGSRAPSAQAENFASANCDFRTQVCSWTWTPSCQCVAICHQHMAP